MPNQSATQVCEPDDVPGGRRCELPQLLMVPLIVRIARRTQLPQVLLVPQILHIARHSQIKQNTLELLQLLLVPLIGLIQLLVLSPDLINLSGQERDRFAGCMHGLDRVLEVLVAGRSGGQACLAT